MTQIELIMEIVIKFTAFLKRRFSFCLESTIKFNRAKIINRGQKKKMTP